jgi:hypothetical protein
LIKLEVQVHIEEGKLETEEELSMGSWEQLVELVWRGIQVLKEMV